MRIYLVGGAVRDYLLGLTPVEKDWVAVNSTPEEMFALGFHPVGKDFPVFLHPVTYEEYALARTERKIGPGYRGFDCYASREVTLEEDLARRDLTINAMAMTEQKEIIDPYGGQRDLKQKILRHVSPAFIEDPVRILRIARFMARFGRLGFSIAPETLNLMQEIVKNGEADALSCDRVWAEMNRALSEYSPELFFAALNQCGALEKLWPEASHKKDIFKSKQIQSCLTNAEQNPNIRPRIFAAYMQNFDRQEIHSFCRRYPVPAYYRELALTANVIQSYFNQERLSAEDVLSLFEKSDAFRRHERFKILLNIFNFSGFSNFSKNKKNFIKIKKSYYFIKKIFINNNFIKKAVNKFIQQGYTGKSLGEKIRAEKLKILAQFF